MATNVKFLTGDINKLQAKNEDGTPIIPIVAGQIYFALSEDKTYGYIVYDLSNSERVVMSTKAQVAFQTEHKLTIGDQVFDGSQDIVIPIYNGDE